MKKIGATLINAIAPNIACSKPSVIPISKNNRPSVKVIAAGKSKISCFRFRASLCKMK